MLQHFPPTSPLPAAVAAAAYLNSLYGDWLDDDPLAITDNDDVLCPRGLPGLFDNLSEVMAHDFWGVPMASPRSHLSYRPLAILSFRVQHCLSGFAGFHFHAANVVLHSAATHQFLHVATLALPRPAAVLAALLFALHAVHVECVANTVGRAELLAAIAALRAIASYQRLLRSRGDCDPSQGPTMPSVRMPATIQQRVQPEEAVTILRCGVYAGVGMLCKEGALTALLVCAALDCFGALRPPRAASRVAAAAVRVSCLGGLSLALLAARLAVNSWRSPTFTAADNSAAFCETSLCRALSVSYLYYLNLRLLALPDNLSHDWSTTTVPNLIDTSDPRLPLALLPYALLAALAALALHRLLRRGRAALATGLALLVLPYLPACHVFVTVGFTVAERVLYLPSAGTCLLAAQPLCRLLSAWPPTTRLATPLAAPLAPSLPRRLARAAGLLLAAAALGGHAVLAVRRNNDWRTNLSLLTSGVAHQPTNAKLQYNLGRALYQLAVEHHPAHAAKVEASLRHLDAAVELVPTMGEAHVLRGAVLRGAGRLGESEAALRTALRLAEKSRQPMQAYFALRGFGETMLKAGREREALRALEAALRINPQDAAIAQFLAARAGGPR